MKLGSIRGTGLCAAALLAQVSAGPLAAQSQRPVLPARSPGFGGAAFFVSPHATAQLGRFGAQGEVEVGWGESRAREGSASLSARLPGEFRLSTHWSGGRAEAAWESRADRSVGITLAHGRKALTVAAHRSDAAVEEYRSRTNGVDMRLGLPIGTPLGLELTLTGRSSQVMARGNYEVTRSYIVAGYEFRSVRQVEYLDANRHQEVELGLGADAGRLRLEGVFGRGFSDGDVPNRTYGYGRISTPIAQRLEVVAEAGRNGGVPAIGRIPQRFARLGLRLNLSGDAAPVETSARLPRSAAAFAFIDVNAVEPRLIIAAQAASVIEIKGDFTGWSAVPMLPLPDGTWYLPVDEGVLHFNIRLDGREWSVPSGVPVIADEFSGAPVAVVVVRRDATR